MKQRYLLLIVFTIGAFLLSHPCKAQPAPQLGAGFIPFVNEKEYLMFFDPAGGLSEGASGANVSWDFTSYVNQRNVLVQYTDPKNDSRTSIFPSATVLKNEPLGGGDTMFSFTKFDTSYIWSEQGNYQSSKQKLIVYSKPRVLTSLGLRNFGDSIVNTYKGSGTFDSAGVHASIIRTGLIKRYYEAYGTLKTNYIAGSSNISRVKTIDHYTDSVLINGNLRVDVVDEINFVWVTSTAPGERLASISHFNRNGIMSDEGFFYCVGCVVPVGVNGVEALNNNFSVYPQPANDFTMINYASAKEQEVTVSITNLLGEAIRTNKQIVHAGNNTIKVNTAKIEAGMYFIHLYDHISGISQKLLIAH